MNQVNKAMIPVSVAPMMDWTDRHCRYFHRLISPNALLYTEMKTSGALVHGDHDRFLRYDESEHPVALQLGGSDPNDLAECAKMVEDYGYDEINLNCGCPSDRVQKGKIGVILMTEPDLVAECVAAMRGAVNIPVTVKTRIGVDEQDDFEFLNKFITSVKSAGCEEFILHARKAWLHGLSPKENRTKPPINYARVKEIKDTHPELKISVNGEIKTTDQVTAHLKQFDSVMIGREAYQNPYILAELEERVFKNNNVKTKTEVALSMIPYIEQQQKDFDTPIKSITRHMIGLFHKQKGAKKWRQTLSTMPHEENVTAYDVIHSALEGISD